MADMLFGSVAPMWSPMTAPILGWVTPPVPLGNHADPYALSAGTAAGALTHPGLNGPEIGATAVPALVAAVAMRRGQPLGPATDQDVEDFICDVLDLLPGASDVEVRCDGGRATLTGSVHHKRVKHDAGEIAWAIPAINDVQNNVTITTRRRSRGTSSREAESSPASASSSRKQA